MRGCRILHINTVDSPSNSVGGIVSAIAAGSRSRGAEVAVASSAGVGNPDFAIGSRLDRFVHRSRCFAADGEGFASRSATEALVGWMDGWKPDVVHLHNLHGHYLNLPTLFGWLSRARLQVVVTLHDCWLLTGHCAFYQHLGCDPSRCACGCRHHLREYPFSLVDRAGGNLSRKSELLASVHDLAVVAPTGAIARDVAASHLSRRPVIVINNGVDLNIFHRADGPKNGILAVAARWERRKCLDAVNALAESGLAAMPITVVGDLMGRNLHRSVTHIPRVADKSALAALYASSSVYFNPSLAESFGLTTVEAMASGTPVVVDARSATAELVPRCGGMAVDTRDVAAVADAVMTLSQSRDLSPADAASVYDQAVMVGRYNELYESLAQK